MPSVVLPTSFAGKSNVLAGRAAATLRRRRCSGREASPAHADRGGSRLEASIGAPCRTPVAQSWNLIVAAAVQKHPRAGTVAARSSPQFEKQGDLVPAKEQSGAPSIDASTICSKERT